MEKNKKTTSDKASAMPEKHSSKDEEEKGVLRISHTPAKPAAPKPAPVAEPSKPAATPPAPQPVLVPLPPVAPRPTPAPVAVQPHQPLVITPPIRPPQPVMPLTPQAMQPLSQAVPPVLPVQSGALPANAAVHHQGPQPLANSTWAAPAPQYLPLQDPQATPQPGPHATLPGIGALEALTHRFPRLKNPIYTIGGLAAIFICMVMVFYFGYYSNPGVIYRQSLTNTGKGYDKLVAALDKQSTKSLDTYTGTGNFSYISKKSQSNGALSFRGNKSNAEATFNVDLGTSRPSIDARFIKSDGTSPDTYLKVSDTKGLATLLGQPALEGQLASYNNTWLSLDHTLVDNATQLTSNDLTTAVQPPSQDQILDAAKAFGKVNKTYLYSTDSSTAVTKVIKRVGTETIDGHKTYHYKVALSRSNTKKYILAQRDALLASKLGSWIKNNKYDDDVAATSNDLAKSADQIKPEDAYDVWMDSGQRILYKVRIETTRNVAHNYVDVGLGYTGGSELPFFISGEDTASGSTASGSLKAVYNTKTYETKFSVNVKTNDTNNGIFTATLTYKPATGVVKVDKPDQSTPINDLLNQFGYGNFVATAAPVAANPAAPSSPMVDAAADAQRKAALQSIQTQLEAAYELDDNYPSLEQMNSADWRTAANLTFDVNVYKDPIGSVAELSPRPAVGVYSYQPISVKKLACEEDSTECRTYKLTATLSDGKTYTLKNLN